MKVKQAYKVEFEAPGIGDCQVVIVEIEEEKKSNKQAVEAALIDALSKKIPRLRYHKNEIEIKDYSSRNLESVVMKDLSVGEFALIFDLKGRL